MEAPSSLESTCARIGCAVDKDFKNYDKVLYRVVLTDDKLSIAGIAAAFREELT